MLLWFRGEREKGDQKEWVGWDGTILMVRITQDLSGGGGGRVTIFPPAVRILCGLACAIPNMRKEGKQIELIKPHKGLSHLLPSGSMSRWVISPIKASSSFLESDVVRKQYRNVLKSHSIGGLLGSISLFGTD